MLKNYLKIAFRTLVRDKSFSILNLLGLAIGLASVMMILGYVRYELSYDKGYSNYPQVYRVLQEKPPGSVTPIDMSVTDGMGAMLKREFPAVMAYSNTSRFDRQFKYRDEIIKVSGIDGSVDFFKMFNYPFIKGNPLTALKDKGSMVITQSFADNYFKGTNPMGKTMADTYGRLRHITGVIKDIPLNTHLTGGVVLSVDQPEDALDMHDFSSRPLYIMLNKNADAVQVQQQFKSVYKKYKFPPGTGVRLQNVADIHLRTYYPDSMSVISDIKYIYIFSSIALLILFIACINYINLTTARSMQRAREIGLRKVLGALRKQLIVQFLTESFLFFLLSTVLAVVIAYTFWPVFSAKITSYQQAIPLFDAKNLLGVLLIFLAGGLLSGAYPAFFLSSLQPVRVLKGLSKFGVNISLRKALVVLQFCISGVLIIATLVVHRQLDYLNNAPLGFNKENLVELSFPSRSSHIDVFKAELMKNAGIKSSSVSDWTMGQYLGGYNDFKDKDDTTKKIRYNSIEGDFGFIETMGLHLVQGRNFSAAYPLDGIAPDSAWRMSKKMTEAEADNFRASLPVILNREAVRVLGLKNPIGTVMYHKYRGTVIGVIENFNGLTLRKKVEPVALYNFPGMAQGSMYVRISSANTSKTIAYIQSQWKRFYPDQRFDFAFTDSKLQQLYTADQRLGSLFGIFSTLAIAIACLGLFGLISLTVQNRVKEIGIRKVLGASVLSITRLISADFVKLVLVSFVISSPIAWYFMNQWLQDFAYRIDIQWWVFALACGITVVIALITLGFQAVKAATANPVKSLRSE